MLASVSSAVDALEVWTAAVTAELIRALGMDVLERGTILVHPGGFGYEIDTFCTALVPATVLAGALGFLPAPAPLRALAMASGAVLVTAVNFARLAALFAIGVHVPEGFSLAHDVVGQAVLVSCVACYWLLWHGWARARAYNGSG